MGKPHDDEHDNKSCFFPILNELYSLTASRQICMEQGGSLAALRKSDEKLNEFIRGHADFRTFAGLWVDATYTGDGTVKYSDGTTANLEKSWRFLYPMKGNSAPESSTAS